MADGMTIGELARSAGVSDSTVRFYERRGLLRPSGRTSGNYRHYASDAVARLRFIRAAQATGFALKDIALLLDFQDGLAACEDVRPVIASRLVDVGRQLSELGHVKDVLEGFAHTCESTPKRSTCPVLDELAHAKLK